MIINYAAPSVAGKGYASRTKINGKPLDHVENREFRIGLVPLNVVEALIEVHEIAIADEPADGDVLVAWRSQITGEPAETLERIGRELWAARQVQSLADDSIRKIQLARAAKRDAKHDAAEQNMIGMDL